MDGIFSATVHCELFILKFSIIYSLLSLASACLIVGKVFTCKLIPSRDSYGYIPSRIAFLDSMWCIAFATEHGAGWYCRTMALFERQKPRSALQTEWARCTSVNMKKAPINYYKSMMSNAFELNQFNWSSYEWQFARYTSCKHNLILDTIK